MIIIIRTRRRREPQVDGSFLDWWCQGRQWFGKRRWRSSSPSTVLQGTAEDTSLCRSQGITLDLFILQKKKSCWESLQLPRTAPPALPASSAWPTAAAALWSLLHSWEGSSFEFPVPAQLQPVQCHHITPCPGPTYQLTGMEAMQFHQAQSSGLTKLCFQTVHDNSYTLISDYTSWFCSHGLQPWHYQKMRQSGGLVSGPTLCFL